MGFCIPKNIHSKYWYVFLGHYLVEYNPLIKYRNKYFRYMYDIYKWVYIILQEFPEYALIRKHIRAFHAAKRFQCPYCEKAFTGSDKLKAHMVKYVYTIKYKVCLEKKGLAIVCKKFLPYMLGFRQNESESYVFLPILYYFCLIYFSDTICRNCYFVTF